MRHDSQPYVWANHEGTIDGSVACWHRSRVTVRHRIGLIAGLPLLSVLMGMYLARSGSPKLLIAVAAVIAIAAARRWPGAATIGALALMALPYTWSPHVPKLGAGLGILAGLFLLVTYCDRLLAFTPTALDWAVLAFAVTPAAVVYEQGNGFHLTNWVAPAITLPYFGFRLLFQHETPRRVFPAALVAIGSLLAVLGVYETVAGSNPFVPFQVPDYTSSRVQDVWNVALYRGGHLRAMSTFGHPIAFGMFLLIPLAFAISRPGKRYLAATVVMLAAEVCTFSRGPWLGALVIVLLLSGWSRRRVTTIMLSAIAAAAYLGPVHRVIVESGSASTAAGHNALYRVGLIRESLHYLSAFGRPTVNLQTVIPGYADVTSLFAGTIIRNGVIGLVELGLIVWLCLRAYVAARRSEDGNRKAATVAIVGSFVGLIAVTLITSYQFFFWALLAYVATIAIDQTRTMRGVLDDSH
jgi:hypothetical protein